MRFGITDESFTAICPASAGEPPLVGQVQHSLGERSAHLTFLLPALTEPHPGLLALLDELSARAGEMGATNLLAEVKDTDASLEVLRKSGFSIYGWETVWKLPRRMSQEATVPHLWEPMKPSAEPAVRSLYQTLVPPLVQTAEPYPGSDVRRLVYRNNGEMIAYVESNAGPKGIYLKPIIHPAAEAPKELLCELANIFQGLGKPVYLQMRSYQAWLTPFLKELAAETTVHFALMVRHLAVPQYSPAAVQRVRLENRQTETSATIIQKMAGQHK
jgi:hypothetical protein